MLILQLILRRALTDMLLIRSYRPKLILVMLFVAVSFTAFATAAQNTDTLQTHLGNGYEALKQEQYETAEKEFRAALAIDPSLSMRARFPLAIALFEQHKYPDSRQEFETVRQAAGDQPGISYYLGRMDLEERNYNGAIENLTKASAHPPFPDTAFYLGLACVKNGSDADAEKWLRKAIEINPDDSRAQYQLATLYRKQGRQDEANQVFQQAKDAKARSDKQSQLKYECGQALEHDPIEKASSVCDQLYDPNDVDKLASLGVLYGQHGYLQQALKPLQRAAELAPQSPQMQYNLAFTYFQMKRYADARGPLEGAVQRWPDLFPLNALYGTVLWDLGEALPAYQALRHAHELNTQDPNTTVLLYQAILELANRAEVKDSHTEALRYLKEAATLVPKSPEPHQRMAAIYKRTGQREQQQAEQKIANQLAQP
jgi:tetratricopeptide (TPR) repeat protein